MSTASGGFLIVVFFSAEINKNSLHFGRKAVIQTVLLRLRTRSMCMWYATEVYKINGYDIALIRRLLQHSSDVVTQRYIGSEPQQIEKNIEGYT